MQNLCTADTEYGEHEDKLRSTTAKCCSLKELDLVTIIKWIKNEINEQEISGLSHTSKLMK